MKITAKAFILLTHPITITVYEELYNSAVMRVTRVGVKFEFIRLYCLVYMNMIFGFPHIHNVD